jgi:hopanoid-associated phosphorylase
LSCIGIISALSSEGRCLTGNTIPVNKPVQINQHAVAIICGMGDDKARIAAQTLLEQNITALLSWGTAGALTENIHSGDLVLADSIVTNDGDRYSFDAEWNKYITNELCNTSLKIHHGMIAHAGQVLATAEDKKRLHGETNALAVDMESLAIAQIANKEKLPCVSIRAIVDEASQCIPEAIIKNTDSFGRPSLFPLFSSLIRNPGLITELIKLGTGMKAATTSLKTVARSEALFRSDFN